jgi:ribonuclease M5
MLKISEAVIVEGRYDKIKLSNLVDTLIIETNGFEIFKNKDKIKFIRKLAEERGIIVITDSDSSGFMIRNFVSSGIPEDRIKHIYIPDIYGKEKRKTSPSSEGKLGVEGIDDSVLIALFEKAGIKSAPADNADRITTADLYELGLSGKPDAKQNKKKLLAALDLPELLSTSSLISYLNSAMTKQEFIDLCNSVL